MARPTIYTDPDTIARFWNNVDKHSGLIGAFGECWFWTGGTTSGYGVFATNGRRILAHRYSWRLHRGSLQYPHVDHLCHSVSLCKAGSKCFHRRCIRPDHLEPVPPLENMRRRHHGAKPTCDNGHAWETNTLYDVNGVRHCYDCIAGAY